ncbi:Protein cramped-like [Holothuria leucospilota]|uniref:Protein cramped-like n=1 Tax=Holothuria leucospilota TaxID=206669 RepID=A0A9Q1BL62_HOLLE|nr:Protein cramped-like [Holothuria leucospilota]
MRKKTDQPVKKVSTIPDSTSLTNHGKTSDGKGGDIGSCPQKGEEGEKILSEKPCAGQRQSNDVECHTHGDTGRGMAEKRPLEIKYQHHNLRSRMKKVKKEEVKEAPTVSSSPASTNKKEHGKSGESPKGEKTEVKKVKRWEAWTLEDTDDFFDALCEHGRDFDAIQRHIEKGHKKRGLAPEQSRNKDQVRHLYYRTVHKVFKFIEPRKDLNRNDGELHALINYGELRRKLKGIAMQKQKWRKLTELIQTGVTSLRINGRNVRLKTPVCKALKDLFVYKEGKEPVKHVRPQKLPAKVTIDLRPIDNATWVAVQSMSYNPRIRVSVHLQKKITSLIKVLSERMIPDSGRREMESKESGKEATPRIIFTIPQGLEVQPYEKVCGRYVLDNCRAPITLKPEQIPEGYCKRKSLNEVLESALDAQEENASGTNCLKSLPDSATQDKTVSAEKVSPNILPEEEGCRHNQTDQGPLITSDSTDRLLSMTPPSQGLTNPSLFDPGGIFNGLDSQDSDDISGKSLPFSSLSPFASFNSGQDSKFDSQPQIGALVKSQKTGAVVGNTILVPSTGEVGNLANNDFMSLNSISDVNILQTDEDSGDKLDCTATLGRNQMPSVTGDSEGLKDLSPVTKNQHPTVDKEPDDTSPQKQPMENADESDLKVFSTKDDIVRQGLTINNSEHISLVDIYLMLGKPSKLGFEYSFIGEESEKWKTNSMLTKLVMLAKNELNVNAKAEPKFVSVGTNTSPVKEEPPPQSFAKSSAGDISLAYKPDATHTAPLITQNGQLALQINPLPPDVQKNHQVSDQRNDFQFARPIAPAPIPVINARSQVTNGEGNTVSLNPSFIVPRIRKRGRPAMVVGRILVPSASPKSSSQLFKDQSHSLPGQRSIRPRPIMPNNKIYGVRKVVTGSIGTVASVLNTSKVTGNVVAAPNISNDILSQAAMSANIGPANFNPSPMKPSGPPVVKKVGITETSQVIKNLPLVLNNNKETITLAALPQMNFAPHQGSSASSIQVNSTSQSTSSTLPISVEAPINVSVSGLSQLNTQPVVSKPSSDEPKSPTPSDMLSLGDLSGLSTPKPSDAGLDRSFMNTPTVSIHDKTPSSTSAALNISPPNLSSLLDISLSSVDGSGNSQDGILSGFRERLHELTKNPEDTSSNVNISLAAALASTTVSVPKGGGDVSPFKAGGENHWLNGENTEMSLGSLLDQLEMSTSERKSGTLTSSTPISSLSIPPPVLLAENSRDSVISKDMDAHLQAMLNENSLDYVAKFADLAAHISATSTEDETNSTTGQHSELEHTTQT